MSYRATAQNPCEDGATHFWVCGKRLSVCAVIEVGEAGSSFTSPRACRLVS